MYTLAALLLAYGVAGQYEPVIEWQGRPQSTGPIIMSGRDMSVLQDSTITYRGSCDGLPVEVTVVKELVRGRLERLGSITMRVGNAVKGIPPSFLGGDLVQYSPFTAGLSCDGTSVLLFARAWRGSEMGEQRARLTIATGEIEVTPERVVEWRPERERPRRLPQP